jgi:hypothetical protein
LEMLCLHFSKTSMVDKDLMKKVYNFPVLDCGKSCQKSSLDIDLFLLPFLCFVANLSM